MSLRDVAVRSAFWVAVEKWGLRVTQLVVFALLARLLEPTDFGLVALASTFIALTGLLVDQGLSKAIVQREHLEDHHCNAAFWTSLALAAALAGLVAVLADPISDLLGDERLAGVLTWLALGIPLSGLSATQAALMQRSFQFRGLAARRLAGTVLGGVAGVAAAVAGAGVWSLVIQLLVTSAVSTLVLWIASSWRPRLQFSRQDLRELWSFGVAVLGIELMGFLNQYADRFIVGAVAGPTALGFYYMGLRIVALGVETLTSVISVVSLPVFSRLQTDIARLRRAFYTCTRVSAIVCIPAFAGLAVVAPLLIPLLFGPHWEQSVPVLQVLCGLGVLSCVAYFDRSALLALRRERWALWLTTAQALLNVVAVLVTAPHGIVAVAIGITAPLYLLWPVRIWILRRAMRLEVRTYLRQWLIPVLAASAMVLVMVLIDGTLPALPEVVQLIALSVLGAAVYTLALRRLAPASFREMIDLLPARVRFAGRQRA